MEGTAIKDITSCKTYPILSVLVKPVSADCNLACRYCFYSSKSKLYPKTKDHHMDIHVLRELVSQFISLSLDNVSFCWQGGEPTLAGLDFYQKVVQYQNFFRLPNQKVQNSIQTNGTLINEEWATFLSKNNFLTGVSIDGPPDIHNYYRKSREGVGSFKRTMNGINLLKKHKVDFNVLVLLNNKNIKHPRKLYKFLRKNNLQYMQFIPCVEKSRFGEGEANYSITPEEYGHFLCSIFDEWVRDGIPQVYIRDFEDILISYFTGKSANCVYSKYCGEYLVVEYNGDVYPCDFYVESKWFLGNLTEQNIEEIIMNKRFSQFRMQKKRFFQKCENCKFYKYCSGGCPKNWEITDFHHNFFCLSYKMFFEHTDQKFLDLKRLLLEEQKQNLRL